MAGANTTFANFEPAFNNWFAVDVRLDENGARTEYVLQFLNRVKIDLVDSFDFCDSISHEVISVKQR